MTEGGRLVWRHVRKSVRNEPLDCRVYALAGLRAIQAMYPAWSLEVQARTVGAVASAIPEAEPAVAPDPAPPPFAATAETAVRLHRALGAVAEAGRVAREAAQAGQSTAPPPPKPPAPPPAPPTTGREARDGPWMAGNYWD